MYKAPKGTRDILPPESRQWEWLIARFADHVSRAGYGLVQSPMFEEIGVFQRVGEGTDVVRKEMYDFHDKGDPPRHLALRPEGTASVVRAFVQHQPPTPFKAWYAAPSFRYEAPQAGRFRQHHQLGVEALGSGDPDLDVEIVALVWNLLTGIGLSRILLLINTMGDPESRIRYTEVLRDYLRQHLADLDPDDRDRVEEHPMRVLDSKREATREVLREAPRLLHHVSAEAAQHFDRVQTGLGALNIPFAIEPRLVRGFDYYTHTTFEVQSAALDGAQNGIAGGGRYDGLVQEMGGQPTPGIGFGMGIERVLLACDAEGVLPDPRSTVDIWVVDVTGGSPARSLTHELRAAGLRADRSFDDRSMRSQLKSANRSGARYALIIGDQELSGGTVTVKDLRSERDQVSLSREVVVDEVRRRLASIPPSKGS